MRLSYPALLLPLLITPVLLANPDRIDRKKGKPITDVTVVEETYSVVKYRKEGSPAIRTVPAQDVLDIVRDDAPVSYQEGRSLLVQGDYENASRLLKLAASEGSAGPWLKEYANFYLGEALRLSGDSSGAQRAYEQVLSIKADSRHFAPANAGIIRCMLAQQRGSAAESKAKKVVDDARSKKLPALTVLELRLLEGKCFAAQKRWREAAGAYKRVAEDAQRAEGDAEGAEEKELFFDLRLESLWAQGEALVFAGDHGQAEVRFKDLARRESPRANALGLLGQGFVAFEKKAFDAARVHFTRVIATQVGAEQEVPRAYLMLGKTYLELAKSGENNARVMARSYLDELNRLYADSTSAVESKKLLEGL